MREGRGGEEVAIRRCRRPRWPWPPLSLSPSLFPLAKAATAPTDCLARVRTHFDPQLAISRWLSSPPSADAVLLVLWQGAGLENRLLFSQFSVSAKNQ